MKVGASLRTVYPASQDARQICRDLIEQVVVLREAGLSSLYVGDHHAQPQHSIQSVPLIARLMAEVGDLPVGALFLVPLYHPVLLAEQVGTLATLADGPFTMIGTIGGGEGQFAAMGATLKTRPSRMEESLTIIRRLLAGETVSFSGRHYDLSNVSISPVPRSPVPIWIAASARAGIERAASMADAWLVNPATPVGEELSTQVSIYRAATGRLDKQPEMRIRRDIYVGESDADAVAATEPHIGGGYRGFRREALLIGSPETVTKGLRYLHDLGFSEVLIRNLVPEQELALASFRRLGKEVLPEVSRW